MFSKNEPERADQQQTIQQLQASLRAKSRMIDNMAYQIRTLSNAVIGFSELLLIEELTDAQREYAQEIYAAGKGLSELVNEVLDWAHLETGRIQVVRAPTNLSELLERLKELFAPAAESKNLQFEVDIDSDLPDTLWLDSERLFKCLVNLTANAVQFTAQGLVQVAVQRRTDGGRDYARFAVIDSGPGISAEKMARLFDPPQSEQDAGAHLLTSLGHRIVATVGLPQTKQLVERLGGRLEAQSQVGCGSIFSIWLPLSECTPPHCQSKPSCADADVASCAERNNPEKPVLLVEDQPSNRLVVQLLLESLGCCVHTAENGQQAVEKACSNAYSLILMDLKMPVMDGYQAAQEIRGKNIPTPIVALSAMELDSEQWQKIRQMFDDCLAKPIDGQQLAKTLEKFGVMTDVSVRQGT